MKLACVVVVLAALAVLASADRKFICSRVVDVHYVHQGVPIETPRKGSMSGSKALCLYAKHSTYAGLSSETAIHVCSPHGYHHGKVEGYLYTCRYGNRRTEAVLGHYKPPGRLSSGNEYTGKGFPVMFAKKPIGAFIDEPEHWYQIIGTSLNCEAPYLTLATHLMKPVSSHAFSLLDSSAQRCFHRMHDQQPPNVLDAVLNAVFVGAAAHPALTIPAAVAQISYMAFSELVKQFPGKDPKIVDREAYFTFQFAYRKAKGQGKILESTDANLPADPAPVPISALNIGSHAKRLIITRVTGANSNDYYMKVYATSTSWSKLLTMGKKKMKRCDGSVGGMFYYKLAIPSNNRVCFQLMYDDTKKGGRVCKTLKSFGTINMGSSISFMYRVARY